MSVENVSVDQSNLQEPKPPRHRPVSFAAEAITKRHEETQPADSERALRILEDPRVRNTSAIR